MDEVFKYYQDDQIVDETCGRYVRNRRGKKCTWLSLSNRKSRDNLTHLGADRMIIVVLKSMLRYNFGFIWLRILSSPLLVNTIMNSGFHERR
jgi:hypothetical protein